MKQLLSAVVLMLFAAIKTFGQCPNTNSGTFCPTFNGAGLTLNTITEFCEMVPGDYQEISNLVAGNTYRISFCNAGSNNPPPTAYNSFMTVYGPGGFVTFNDDFCGTNSQVEFVAPASGTYRVLCNVSGNCSATSFSITPATITLVNAPSSSATVSSINRASTNPTNAGLVNYTVTFSGSVSGLTASNFSLTTTGGISGASVGTPTGSGTTWTVPVNTGSGNGTIRLDLANATGLSPSVTTPYTSGQVYDVDKTGPSIIIGTPSANSASCGSVTYTVTYTGASTISLVNGNITLNTTGNASASVAVSGSGTSTRTVTLNNFTGTGTLGINIAANTATDVVGNNAAAAGPSGTFTVSPPPSATISYSGSPFCNSGTASVTLSGSSSGTFSSTNGLSLNSSSGEINLATSTPGTYTVTYTIAASGGCSQFQTTAGITITAAPSATISYSGSPFCNSGTANVTLSGSSGGVFASTGGLSLNSSSGEVNLATSTPGTYNVTYSIAASGGCAQFQTSSSITITAAPSATISYLGSPYCNSGTASVTLSGSSGGIFASTGGLSLNSASGEVNLAASTPGAYTVTYTTAASGGCSQFQTSAGITITAAPSATISYSGSPFCNSGTASVTLSGSSSGTFSSTNGLSLNSSSGEINLATSTPGTYTVTYSIAASGGCSQFQTTAGITITAAPSATISYSGSPYCNSGTANVTLSGSSGGVFSSTGGLSLNSSSGEVNLAASTPGTYTVTYTIAASGGCSQFQTTAGITITATPSATISYSGSPYCNSGTASVTLSGSSVGSFSSTGGLNINSASGEVNLAASTPGTYTVTYTIATSGGCAQFQTSSSITITAAPSATISYPGSPYCNSGTASVTLSGSSVGSFSSTGGLNINSASGEVNLAASTPGTYTVTYTIAASGGCAQFQTSGSITINAAPSATISYSGSPFCNSGTANVTLSGSSGGVFSSTGGLSLNSSSGEINLATSTPGTYTVTYTIAASGGCSQFQTTAGITITAAPSATISYSGSPYCNSGTVSVTLSGSSGGVFSSTGGLNINSASGEVNLAASTPGAYTVTYTIAASGGCAQFQTSGSITINAAPSATISYSGSPFCNSGTANVTLSGSSGGIFASTGGLSLNSSSGEVNLAASTPGTYNVTYSIAASGGCAQFQTSGSITINAAPSATISYSGSSYCNSGTASVTLSGSSGGMFSSTSGLSLNSSSGEVNLAASTPGTYNVTYSIAASGGCAQFQTTTGMTVNATPNASIGHSDAFTPNASPKIVCQNGPASGVIFTASGGSAPYTFTYQINGSTIQTATLPGGNSVTVSQPTASAGLFSYTLIGVQDANGCSQTQTGTLTIIVVNKPTVTLSIQGQSLNEGNSLTLCDNDMNPSNLLLLNVATGCIAGSILWRTQIGNGAWSAWSTNTPAAQPSNHQTYRYQAACDSTCASNFTNPISLTINYRASTPQNVFLSADGITLAAGQTKTVCDEMGNTLIFNATCASGELLLYSVDGGEYSNTVPSQIVDGKFHNYRVRCRKEDGTPSCAETESAVISLKILPAPPAPTVNITPVSGCDATAAFSGNSTCGNVTTIWYNAVTNQALPTLPTTLPNATVSYYARCQNEAGCLGDMSNTVTFTFTPTHEPPVVTVSNDLVCAGTEVTVSTSCPAGATVFWNTGILGNSFRVAFSNVTRQTYIAHCVFTNGCQSLPSAPKTIYWKAFDLTFINIGSSQSGVQPGLGVQKTAWASRFITPDAGPALDYSSESNPTIFHSENVNKTAPRFWTIHAETCHLGTNGSLTFDMLATPETGVIRSYNTHENNAPYLMYANRDGFTELYAQNHPAYGFFVDNGSGGNVYDAGLPKGLYKLGIRYWDQKGQGSIYPSTRQPQGNVLAYQEYWFRIQSQNGVGTGAVRMGEPTDNTPWLEIEKNPVTDQISLQLSGEIGEKVQLNLINPQGQLIQQRNIQLSYSRQIEVLHVLPIPSGLYLLKAIKGDKAKTVKVLKVN